MKYFRETFVLITLVFISANMHAQNQGYISDFYMSGKWTAECTSEVVDQATIRYCGLCSYLKNPNDSTSWHEAENIELNFQPDTLVISQDDKITRVTWARNTDNHSFSFKFNKKLFHFRMFLYGSQKRIIEDDDGFLLILEKSIPKEKK